MNQNADWLNLGLDYLPGSVMFDPVADKPDADLASRIVWFDAYVVDNAQDKAGVT